MKATIALRPTTDQIDLFGEATSKRNNAEKVRESVLPILKLSYQETGNSVFEGNHWVVKASDGRRRDLDVHKLIEVLAELGVKEPATLVEGCYTEQTFSTFRVQPLPSL